MQAHLIGGVPESEVRAKQDNFAKFGVVIDTLFQSERPGYFAFRTTIATKASIKTTLELNAALQKTPHWPTNPLWRHGGAWPATTSPSFAMARKCRHPLKQGYSDGPTTSV